MEASRVTISQATIDAYKTPMTFKKKKEIRQENIMAYIKRRPAGTRIKLEELKNVGGFNNDGSTDAFIKRMIRDKMIARENITPRTYCYWVVEDGAVRVVKGPDPRKIKYTIGEIEELARQYSWSHEFSHNDLRKFIGSLKKEQHEQRKPEPDTSGESSGTESGSAKEDVSGA